MLSEPTQEGIDRQKELVKQYATRLRETACGTGNVRPGAERSRRCYELLNDLAMQLSDLDKRRRRSPGDRAN